MKSGSRWVFLAFIFLLGMPLFSDDKASIETAFMHFFSSYQRSDFESAADLILPKDLEDFKAKVLPVLLKGFRDGSDDKKRISSAILEGRASDSIDQISPRDFILMFFTFLDKYSDQQSKLLKTASFNVNQITFSDGGGLEARIDYSLILGKDNFSDFYTAMRDGDRWYIRLNTSFGNIGNSIVSLFNN